MYLLLLLACESTAPASDPFAPVSPAKPAAQPADPSAPPPDNSEWKFSTALPTVSSEELQRGSAGALQTDLFGGPVSPGAVPRAPESAGPAAAPPAKPAPPALDTLPSDPWPVRLVATLPAAQPPRAILGLPSGEERVVAPGSILPEQGIVVLAVSRDRVQIAKITPAGDHATIDAIELTAQYPGGQN